MNGQGRSRCHENGTGRLLRSAIAAGAFVILAAAAATGEPQQSRTSATLTVGQAERLLSQGRRAHRQNMDEVALSVLVHGASAVPLSVWYGRRTLRIAYAEERESTAAGLFGHAEGDAPTANPALFYLSPGVAFFLSSRL